MFRRVKLEEVRKAAEAVANSYCPAPLPPLREEKNDRERRRLATLELCAQEAARNDLNAWLRKIRRATRKKRVEIKMFRSEGHPRWFSFISSYGFNPNSRHSYRSELERQLGKPFRVEVGWLHRYISGFSTEATTTATQYTVGYIKISWGRSDTPPSPT